MKEPIIQSIFPTPIYTTKINRGLIGQRIIKLGMWNDGNQVYSDIDWVLIEYN